MRLICLNCSHEETEPFDIGDRCPSCGVESLVDADELDDRYSEADRFEEEPDDTGPL